MSQVDFYILSDPGSDAVPRQACQLISETWAEARVYVHTGSVPDMVALDRLLWTWRQDSFIPHEALQNGTVPDAPVLIGTGPIPPVPCPVLLNLSDQLPVDCQRFDRIMEIVPAHEERRAAGRARFKAYRDQGHALRTHSL